MKYIGSFLTTLLMGSSFIATSAFALPFSIVPNGPLPASIQPGGIAFASYTITNITKINPPRNLIKYLPPNVQINQTTSTCIPSSGFVLAPGQSCRLNLTISGSVSNTDSNPHHHLFVCMSDAATCAGPNPANSLNVTVTTNISPVLYGVSGSVITLLPFTANNLYMLDAATAKTTLIMPLSDAGNAPVIASDGNSLYHLSGSIIGFKRPNNLVFEIINLQSLTTSAIPLSGQSLGEAYGAVFYRNANAFLVTNNGNNFNTITTSGFGAQIGTMTLDGVTGLACYNHNIYGATSDRAFSFPETLLLRIDPTNGAILTTTPITLAGFVVSAVQGLTVNPNTGTFYAVLSTTVPSTYNMGLPLQQKLVTIDVNTGIATLIGDITETFFTSIAFNPADSSC